MTKRRRDQRENHPERSSRLSKESCTYSALATVFSAVGGWARAGVFSGVGRRLVHFQVRNPGEPVILKDDGHGMVFAYADRVPGSASHRVVRVGVENGGDGWRERRTVSGDLEGISQEIFRFGLESRRTGMEKSAVAGTPFLPFLDELEWRAHCNGIHGNVAENLRRIDRPMKKNESADLDKIEPLAC